MHGITLKLIVFLRPQSFCQ